MPTNNGKDFRITVTLSPEDDELLIKLRASMEARLKRRVSVSNIVRIALSNQAKVEGLR